MVSGNNFKQYAIPNDQSEDAYSEDFADSQPQLTPHEETAERRDEFKPFRATDELKSDRYMPFPSASNEDPKPSLKPFASKPTLEEEGKRPFLAAPRAPLKDELKKIMPSSRA